jgi:hypothetical protein
MDLLGALEYAEVRIGDGDTYVFTLPEGLRAYVYAGPESVSPSVF